MTADTSHELWPAVDPSGGLPGPRSGDLTWIDADTQATRTLPAVVRSPSSADGAASGAAPKAAPLARRHRILLRIADGLALSVAAGIGAGLLQTIEPVRAGDVAVRHIVVTAVAMLLAFHLHALYRRPGSRLRPSGWWRPWVVARCLPTAALVALGTEVLLFAGDRMTLTTSAAAGSATAR